MPEITSSTPVSSSGAPLPAENKSGIVNWFRSWFQTVPEQAEGLSLRDRAVILAEDAKISDVASRAFDQVDSLVDRVKSAVKAVFTKSEALPQDGRFIQKEYGGPQGKFFEEVARHDLHEMLVHKTDDEASKIAGLGLKGKKFLDSNYFRDLIKDKGYQKAAEEYLSAPINMRTQSLRKEGENAVECQFMRMGAFTDLRNGFTNLKELKELQKDPMKLALKKRELAELQGKVKNEDQALALERALLELNDVEKTIQERRAGLQSVFIEMLQQQVVNKGVEGDRFLLMQLSLLNPEKNKWDETGWMHNEGNAILDMAEMYKEMDGKKIVIGEEAHPRVTEDAIYLPIGSEKKTVILDAAFMNFSVQGHTKNDGIQREVNVQAVHVLARYANNPAAAPLLDALRGQSSNYKVAENVGMEALKLGALTINCASGKDRTGAVAGRLALKHLPRDYEYKYKNQLLDSDGVAANVVYDNTKVKVLKVDPREVFFFPGLSTAAKARFLWNQARLLCKLPV